MKPLLSPLLLKDFAVTENRFTILPISKEGNDFDELFDEYSIDIDFDYSKNDLFYAIVVQVKINNSEDSPQLGGYSIMVEGTSLFEFNQTDEITNEDKASLLNYSGLSITINYIRGFIATLTSFAPFGRYNLPTIDVNDLLSQKRDMKKEK
jgi:preprotein translocase subunit SecB